MRWGPLLSWVKHSQFEMGSQLTYSSIIYTHKLLLLNILWQYRQLSKNEQNPAFPLVFSTLTPRLFPVIKKLKKPATLFNRINPE
jgi:hypothetical protein